MRVTANTTGSGPWAEATKKAREMVGKMTLEEKVSAWDWACGVVVLGPV